MFLAAALALCGLPLSGVFRSEFQIVAGGFAEPQYVGVTLLLVFVNLAFFGIIWHAGRMVLSPRRRSRPGTRVVARGRGEQQRLDDRRRCSAACSSSSRSACTCPATLGAARTTPAS